ncbi:hypothetical protein WJX75_004652 [Coccomyxa subellipsoidea]|uniref:Uncharacterized protein n=1 Tax=Coccomyxa subellipsoidea TaxID=248742 RepID=A0ABR2YHQ2_9CHLO
MLHLSYEMSNKLGKIRYFNNVGWPAMRRLPRDLCGVDVECFSMEDQFGDMQPVYHTEGPLNISRAVGSEQRNIPRASGTCTCVLTGVHGDNFYFVPVVDISDMPMIRPRDFLVPSSKGRYGSNRDPVLILS